MTKRALVVVDVQNDFCPGGSLAVADGDLVIGPLNRQIAFAVENGWEIYFSRDWHPAETKHFEKWPVHCVQNTPGAEFHPDLQFPDDPQDFQVISKGMGDTDDYSAFDGGMLPRAEHLYVGGLATDYCVLWTANRARELGYEVTLLQDACRAVDIKPGDGQRALDQMRGNGVRIAATEEVLRELGT